MLLKSLMKLEVPLHSGASSVVIKEVENEFIESFLKSDEQTIKITDDEKYSFVIQIDQRTIGAAVLTKETREQNTGKLNFWIEYDYMTSGIGTIVAAEIIQYAVKHLKLQSICSNSFEPLWGNSSEPFSSTLASF